MRIIAGRLKGRPITAPKGHSLRPTADPVKETLFNMIGNRIHEALVLDLFAGTGNVGIEAISRGAAEVVFVEKDRRHVMCLNENILRCKITKQSTVYHGDANKALLRFRTDQRRFDVAFLDPPYRQTIMLADLMKRLLTYSLMAETGLLTVEHATSFTPLSEPGCGFFLTKQRRIGDTTLSIYAKHQA